METYITDKARPYNMTFYRLSKIAASYNRDLTTYEIDKCKNDTLVFDGDNCVNNALDFSLEVKGEPRKTIIKKIVGYNLQLHAHNGSGFDTCIILNNLFCDKHLVDVFKNGKGIISLRVFNGYIQNSKKQIPLYLIFRCGLTHLKYSLNKLGKTFKLQKEFSKTEMNHDEIDEINWRDKKNEWVDYVKTDV